jgi:hypothetical protein
VPTVARWKNVKVVKGQCHEIFDLPVYFSITNPIYRPLIHDLKYFEFHCENVYGFKISDSQKNAWKCNLILKYCKLNFLMMATVLMFVILHIYTISFFFLCFALHSLVIFIFYNILPYIDTMRQSTQ